MNCYELVDHLLIKETACDLLLFIDLLYIVTKMQAQRCYESRQMQH